MNQPIITLYVVYKEPTDYPGKFVVRKWYNSIPSSQPLIVTENLQEARNAIPKGLYNIGRNVDDDPAIHEVWI